MSTPIEIVREYRLWQRRPVLLGGYEWSDPPHTREEFDEALAAVLLDAERYKALEAAHDDVDSNLGWARFYAGSHKWSLETGTLAELADRLKGTK